MKTSSSAPHLPPMVRRKTGTTRTAHPGGDDHDRRPSPATTPSRLVLSRRPGSRPCPAQSRPGRRPPAARPGSRRSAADRRPRGGRSAPSIPDRPGRPACPGQEPAGCLYGQTPLGRRQRAGRASHCPADRHPDHVRARPAGGGQASTRLPRRARAGPGAAERAGLYPGRARPARRHRRPGADPPGVAARPWQPGPGPLLRPGLAVRGSGRVRRRRRARPRPRLGDDHRGHRLPCPRS